MNELNKRISRLRKAKGYSQEEFAKLIEMSRSAFAQLELGNRHIKFFEIEVISKKLGVSMNELAGKEFKIFQDEIKEEPTKIIDERISIPKLKRKKFENVLLYILEKCAGKPNVGEAVLYKLLYFSDFNYFELYEEQMTGAAYRKLPRGPVPFKIDIIVYDMVETGKLKVIKTEYFGYPQKRFLPLVKADLTTLKASEKEVIDNVIDQLSDMSASGIAEYSHFDIPWKATKEGKVIDYELVFYRSVPYSQRIYKEDAGDDI
jgi:transcriptional regulator with XRE-family HTH domain